MVLVNGVLRDLYLIFLGLGVVEVLFGHDLLFQPARIALVAITLVLALAKSLAVLSAFIDGSAFRGGASGLNGARG